MNDIMQSVTEEVSKQLSQKMEDIFIEGLKMKGYEFDNKIELESFVKLNCECLEYLPEQRRVYTVKKIPFLVHYYGIELDMPKEGDKYRLKATNGKYKFL